MVSATEKKMTVRNRNILKLKQIDEQLDYLLAHGSLPGESDIDGLLYDRTILFDVLVAQGCEPWEYNEKTWVKS